MLNKDEIKNNLTAMQIFQFLETFGGEPAYSKNGDIIISKTICHNPAGEGSRKLYYYDNTKLFRCWTECNEYFDIFQLVCKIKNQDVSITKEWELFDAIRFVSEYFGLSINFADPSAAEGFRIEIEDWALFDRLKQKESVSKIFEMKTYDDSILKYYPQPHIGPWEREGISYESLISHNIKYDSLAHGIIIPHYDEDNHLIGIRERTLIKDEEVFGKYKPAILGNQMYNHPLGFALYNLNNSKEAIKIIKKAIIFEGEKSTLLYSSFFGKENDISVACCGSSLSKHQLDLLLQFGCKEIIIAFDKQFQEIGDKEWKQWTKKLTELHQKYSQYVTVSFLFDKKNLLGYKDSPIDCGKEVFIQLYNERVFL